MTARNNLMFERSIAAYKDVRSRELEMKIQIRHPGLKLTKSERAKLEGRLDVVLARFGQRIGLVVVRVSDVEGLPGYKRCQLEIGLDLGLDVVSAEHSDINIFLALEHAASRAARSVGRAIEKQAWSTGH